MSAPRPIGVIGGMGPEATILFLQLLLGCTPAEDDADHVPVLVDGNTQVPSRIRRLTEGSGDDPAPVLARMAQGLHRAGAAALVMPCNTAHLYAGAIRTAVPIPFLDMRDLAAAEVARRFGPGRRIGVLGSPALRIGRVFDTALAGIDGSVIYGADEAAQLAAIRAIKAGRRDGPEVDRLASIAEDLVRRGAEVVLIACSEFSLVPLDAGALPVIDTLEVLARAARDVSLAGKATLPS